MNCKFFFHSSVHVIQLYQDCRRLRAKNWVRHTGIGIFSFLVPQWPPADPYSGVKCPYSDLKPCSGGCHTSVSAHSLYRNTPQSGCDWLWREEQPWETGLNSKWKQRYHHTHTHTLTHNNMWRTVLPPRTSTASGNCCSTVVGLSVCIYILQHHCWFRLVALKAKPIASTITQSSAVSMQRPRPP